MGTLLDVEDTGLRFNLHGSHIISCFYMNELLIRLLHSDEPHEEIYLIYQQALADLAHGTDEQKILRVFEKKLLQELGYGLALEYEANTGDPVSPEKSYYYVTDRGVCQENAQANECVRISGKSLMALHLEDDWNAEIATETKKLLRMVLKTHVGDKPLGSRELYRAYLQNLKGI